DGTRWWIMQLVDAWNDVPAAPGSRTHGTTGGAFVITGPNFKGKVPGGLEVIRCDTSLAALGGRTYTGGPDDYVTVHRIQDGYQLMPLSQWERATRGTRLPGTVAVKPGVDATTPVPTQVFAMTADQFFGRLCALLVNNPARGADAPVMGRLATLG